MNLYLRGHAYKYAAEQILLTMFPSERPEYPETGPAAGEDDCAVVTLSRGAVFATAGTALRYGGKRQRGFARVRLSALTDKLVTDRLLQRCIKLSFYRAAAALLGQRPAWGALTGIRPGKLATQLMESGLDAQATVQAMVREYDVTPERAALCTDTSAAGLSVKRVLEPRDVALYVGIPFCPTRCAYCSFVSHSVEKSMRLIEPFLAALNREIEAAAAAVRDLGLRVISVYIGGGTPTTLTAEQLASLLAELRRRFDLSACREFTVEAGRPDTITDEKLAELAAGGVTRISINPQSMSDEVLAAIGRRHSAADILTAYAAARRAGIPAVNMDLIAGLPADTPEGFRQTLDTVLELGPENVTVHTLSLKKGTRITLEGTPIPDRAAVADMLDYAGQALRGGGFRPYYLYRQKFISGGFENVGWALPGFENLYNICIMEELCSILAMGGGGSTKLVAAATGRIERIFNAKYPYEYIENADRICAAKQEIVDFYRKEMSWTI